MECNCGGSIKSRHTVGEIGCLRKKASSLPRKVSCEDDRWLLNGKKITGTTLRSQWGFSQHKDGSWSEPKEAPIETTSISA